MSYKAALAANMDAQAIQMDCRDYIKLAYEAINKSLSIERTVNQEIEGQMKLRLEKVNV
jgi:hypothetical protein